VISERDANSYGYVDDDGGFSGSWRTKIYLQQHNNHIVIIIVINHPYYNYYQ